MIGRNVGKPFWKLDEWVYPMQLEYREAIEAGLEDKINYWKGYLDAIDELMEVFKRGELDLYE